MTKEKDIEFYELLDELLTLKDVLRIAFNEYCKNNDEKSYLLVYDIANKQSEKLNQQLKEYYVDENDAQKSIFCREMELNCIEFREILTKKGFNLIGFSIMLIEDTFIFETDEEAKNAYNMFEGFSNSKSPLIGWWYGKEEYKKARKEYEKRMGTQISCMWLDKKTDSFKFDRD